VGAHHRGEVGERDGRIVTGLSVLIADDDDLMRAGLNAILASDDTIDVVAEAADGDQAIRETRRCQPDVVLMDVRMPKLDGIAATREIIAAAPQTRILILTTFEDDDYVFGALSAGASGFLLKRTQPEELIAAIHVIAGGESLLSPSITRTVVNRLARQPRPDLTASRRLRELTPREREILQHVARGLSNQEIAAALYVEESTVKTHLKRIFAKLGLRDRVQAVILGYETGLVRPGESQST
jgi:DNA-binding NarL/FixJ family response regulator